MSLLRDYLCHCYLYYGLDEPVISDHEFDDLCRRINDGWDELPTDEWKAFMIAHSERKGLIKGLSLLPDQYPDRIRMRAGEMQIERQDLERMMNG